jgi:ATP-dependent Lon protease
MTFDHKTLETLPVPDADRIQQVLKILKTIAVGRVMPYFKNKRGTDPTVIARLAEHLVLHRLEAEQPVIFPPGPGGDRQEQGQRSGAQRA